MNSDNNLASWERGENDKNIYFKKMGEYAKIPSRKLDSVGFDLYSAETKLLESKSVTVIETNICVSLPPGTYGRIASRSGLALHGIFVEAGVIDRDYTGNIQIVLYNSCKTSFSIAQGDRVAQLVVEKASYAPGLAVDHLPEIESKRGHDGFGSTGLQN